MSGDEATIFREEFMSTKELKQPKIGDHVIFFDQFGMPHDALLTAVWGESSVREYTQDGKTVKEDYYPSVNVLLISPDERREDSYGRQVERQTSVVHSNDQCAWGNFYCFPEQKEAAKDKCIKAKNKEFGIQI